MILKTYPNKNIYGNYFLATEAPDDEEVTEDQPKPRRNVKVVTVKPSNRGRDFTTAGDPPIDPETVETNQEIDTDDTDYAMDDEIADTPEPTTVDEPATDDATPETAPTTDTTTDDVPDTGEGDTTDYTQTGTEDAPVDTGDVTDTEVDAPDTGGAEDFTTSGDDGSGTSTDTSANTDPNTTNKFTPPGVELDSTRKYNLYKEFMSLYNACDNYISKLENLLRNDYEENQIIRISVNNLREIKDIIADYMTIRFQLNTYVQSLLFYQKMVVAVQLVFNLLKSIRSTKTSNDKKPNTKKK